MEETLKFKVSLMEKSNGFQQRKELSPIQMQFEIPQFNVSNLQIRYLKIEDRDKPANFNKWVRYLTLSSSYVCRLWFYLMFIQRLKEWWKDKEYEKWYNWDELINQSLTFLVCASPVVHTSIYFWHFAKVSGSMLSAKID